LGLAEAPTVQIAHLTATQKRAYILADNRLAEKAGWDKEILAVKDCSKQGDIVLDPFCGSGTIIVAAERTGHKARALEIDAAYVDVAIRRWEQLTGKSATLSTGGTFEEITEQRTVELDLAQVEAVALLAGGNHVGVL
jgi:hypothetical protein